MKTVQFNMEIFLKSLRIVVCLVQVQSKGSKGHVWPSLNVSHSSCFCGIVRREEVSLHIEPSRAVFHFLSAATLNYTTPTLLCYKIL